MHILGDTRYASRLDTKKLALFLQEQGMSEKERAALEIRFLSRLPGWGSRSDHGHYHPGKHRISIATWMTDSQLEGEALYGLNGTLLHEIRHALDRRNWKVRLASLFPYVLGIGLPLFLNWVFLRGTPWFFLPFVLIPLVAPAFIYRYGITERRARTFEKRHGGSSFFFSL